MSERDQFMRLEEARPVQGDILITKIWSDSEPTKVARNIVRGQAIFSRMYKGSKRSEHAAICTRIHKLCESLPESDGVEEDNIDYDDSLVVFRARDGLLRDEVGRVASLLARNTPNSVNAHLRYSGAKAKRSVFKMRYLGSGGRDFLQAFYVLAYQAEDDPVALAFKEKLKHGMSAYRHVFCSSFVCACLEVASLKVHGVPCLNVDPRAISPKAFEALLRRSGKFLRGRAVQETEAERQAYRDAF